MRLMNVKRALAVFVAVAYVTLVVGVWSDGSVWALLPGTVVALLATVGFAWVERRGRRALAAGYVVVQLALGYLTFGLSGASVGGLLLLVALVSQSVLLLPLPWVAVPVTVTPFVHVGMD